MNKDTIEIKRAEKIPHGYWLLSGAPTDGCNDVLNAIVEWSRDKNVTVYRHVLRHSYESYEKYKGEIYDLNIPEVPPAKIDYCDLVFYCDIYYQEK